MSKKSKTRVPQSRPPSPVSGSIAAYYATVMLMLVASIWPTTRVWGLNWWAYFPMYVQGALLVVALLLPILGRSISVAFARRTEDSNRYWIYAAIVSVAFLALFILLRARAHFLGDGYTLIGLLSADQPILKFREIGESLVHLWARNLFGGANAVAALNAYQAVSIAAGMLFVGSAVFVSRRLFENSRAAITFLFGTLGGGYLLLYFGYVENYSLFVLSVAWFAWTGIFIGEGRISRWWILVPQAAAAGFHIFGFSLLPATLYCLFHNSPFQGRWKALRSEVRWTIIGCGVAILAAIFLYFYLNDLFFRIAILPLVPHEFTVDGYILLSGAHLLDLVNLIFLLVPGVLVMLSLVLQRRTGSPWQNPATRFLLLLALSSFLVAFIFDPKIGMPRDWDLFSFMGIPLVALLFYTLLNRKSPLFAPAWLAIGLGLLVLIPRAVGQTVEPVALEHALAYKDLDRVKNRQFYTTLTNYCKANGLDSLGASLNAEMHRRFPGRAMGDEAHRLVLAGQYRQAITLSGRILKRNPFYHGVWANMGTAYLYVHNYDSAIACYEIASALNPGRAELYGNTGAAYIELGDFDKAIRLLQKAIDRDSTEPSYVYNLGRVAKEQGDNTTYVRLLARAAMMPKGYAMYRMEYLAILMSANRVDRAKEVLALLRQQKVDADFYDSLYTLYPQLRE